MKEDTATNHSCPYAPFPSSHSSNNLPLSLFDTNEYSTRSRQLKTKRDHRRSLFFLYQSVTKSILAYFPCNCPIHLPKCIVNVQIRKPTNKNSGVDHPET